MGLATSAELSSIQPTYFANLDAGNVDTSLQNLFNAGLSSFGSLDTGSDASGVATIIGLQQIFNAKFAPYAPIFELNENPDGSYQVAELQTDTASDGIYSNFSDSGQTNYVVTVTNPTGVSGPADISVTTNGNTSNFSLIGSAAPNVLVDSNGSSVSAAGDTGTILIGNNDATLNGGSGQTLLLALGSNDTLHVSSGITQALVAGTGNVVTNDVAGDTVNLLDGSSTTINGSDGVIDISDSYETGQIWIDAQTAPSLLSAADSTMNAALGAFLVTQNPAIGSAISVVVVGYGNLSVP